MPGGRSLGSGVRPCAGFSGGLTCQADSIRAELREKGINPDGEGGTSGLYIPSHHLRAQ